MCFVDACQNKVRLALGASHLFKPNDSVLLCYSGGLGSRTLLHTFSFQLSGAAKPLQVRPLVVYVDESAVLGLSDEEVRSSLRFLSC